MALTLDKTFTKPEILTRYLNLVSFGNGAFRHPGRRADLLRHRRLAAELAAGGAAGRPGPVDQHARSLHQPRRRAGAAKPGVGHDDRQHPGARRRAAGRQGAAAGHPGAAQRIAAGLHRRWRRAFFCDYVQEHLARAGISKDQLSRAATWSAPPLDPDIQAPVKGRRRQQRGARHPGHRERDERDPAGDGSRIRCWRWSATGPTA